MNHIHLNFIDSSNFTNILQLSNFPYQEVLDVGDDRGGDELVNGPTVLVEGIGLGVVGGGDGG